MSTAPIAIPHKTKHIQAAYSAHRAHEARARVGPGFSARCALIESLNLHIGNMVYESIECRI